MRLITFSRFDEHSSPLFKYLDILKLKDLVTIHVAIFMFKFYNQLLPANHQELKKDLYKAKHLHSYGQNQTKANS